MANKRKPIDPDRRRGSKDNSWTHPIRVDGEIEGQVTIWDWDNEKDDRHEALVLCEYADGEICAYIEKEGE